jgi:Fur family transcriptional regulator, ferric uptake regulator
MGRAMTVSPENKPMRFRDLEDVEAALRAEGTRMTTPRRLVLQALFAADSLVSAERVATGEDTGISLDLTSVYRNLERLEELGVVRHVHLGHGPSLYGLVGQGEREYLVCEGCGKVTVADTEALDRVRAVIEAEFGYDARFTHFPIHGRCADCRAS